MIDVRKIMNILPTLIVGSFLISFVLFSWLDWYANIYPTLEKIEIVLYFTIAIDFCFNSKYYSILAKRSIATIISQCTLYYYTELIKIEAYYTIYGMLMFVWVLSILQINARNSKDC